MYRPTSSTSGSSATPPQNIRHSGTIAHEILKNSSTSVHGILKNSTRGIFEDSVCRNSGSGVSENLRAQRYSADPYREHSGAGAPAGPGVQKLLYHHVSEDLMHGKSFILEFLRIPVRSNTPPSLIFKL